MGTGRFGSVGMVDVPSVASAEDEDGVGEADVVSDVADGAGLDEA